jgi:arylformamidase
VVGESAEAFGERMTRIYDISVTVTPDLPVWPGDPAVILERVAKMEAGSDANISRMDFGVHTGTHVDAPFHFIADGTRIEDLSLDALIGPAVVVEFAEDVDEIDAARLSEIDLRFGIERVLFKTRNSSFWGDQRQEFRTDFVAIAPDGAEWLVQRGIRLVGIDYLSVAPFDDPGPTHRILLGGQIVALEGLDLSQVPAGNYMLYCLPMKLGGSDGAPARAILIAAHPK